MNYRSRILALQRRRRELIAQCESDRSTVGALGEQWRAPLAAADRVVSAVNFMRAHASTIAAGAGALMLMLIRRSGRTPPRRGGFMRWVRRGAVAWRAYAAFRHWRLSRYERA